MHITSVSAMAVLAFATHASASKAMPYKPLMKMSVHQMFGLGRREDTSGYQPTQSICGTGTTCAEACGENYEACTSSDEMVHCFNPAAAQTCCPDASGNSCDAGYYCTSDTGGETWCCPHELDVVACAAAYSVTGGLVSQTPEPTTEAAPTSYPEITTTPNATTTAGYPSKNATVTAIETGTTTTCLSTVGPSATYPASNETNTFTPSSVPTPSDVGISGASIAGPAGLLALVAAAGVAALL